MASCSYERFENRFEQLRVALVSSGSGSRGGGEIYLTLLAQGLAGQGCVVEAIVPDHERMDELANNLSSHAHVHRTPFTATYDRRTRVFGALLDRSQQRDMADLFRKLAPDLIHVNQQVAEDGVDLLLAAKRSGLPWISTIHIGRSAAELGAVAGSARDWATRLALRLAKGHHIAVSDVSRDQLVARFSRTGANFHTVHNGTAAPDPAILKEERRKARASWGVADDEIVIGTVGRIEEQKNPSGFLEAVSSLSDYRNVRCIWIGDGSLRGALEEKAKNYRPLVDLHIDGWRDDASLRMAGFDIFLLPSLFEGLPFAVIEAMHVGLPIVASKSDGFLEAISDGKTGFLCNNAAEIADRLQVLLDDPGIREHFSAAAQIEARKHFTLREMAQKTLSQYHTTVLRGRPQ